MTETLAGVLRERANRDPDSVFLVHDDRELTYREVDEASNRVANALADKGHRHGDRLAIAAPNVPEWVIVLLGAAKLGVIVVTLNVRYQAAEFEYMLTQSGARGLVVPERVGERDFRAFVASLSVALQETYFLGADEDPFGGNGAPVDVELSADDPVVILYTSGTTGRPKGAVLTNGSILASGRAQTEHLGLDRDVIIGNMPFNHVGGLTCSLTTTLVSGGTLVLMPAFSPSLALELIQQRRATIFAGVPTMWHLMLTHPSAAGADLSSLRFAIAGGSNLEPALAEAITQRVPGAQLVNLYGMSELSGAAVMSPLTDDAATVAATLGVVIGAFEHRVVDLAGDPTDGEGELQLRGALVAAGYWEMPDETRATFLADGWLTTGDVVSTLPDGHLVFRSRRKEMFIQGGYNVYPAEVENTLTAHPDVAMAAGVGIHDDVLGEVGRFYVIRSDGSDVDADELTTWCRERLADYKVPREFVFVTELPLTPAGKVQKALLSRD